MKTILVTGSSGTIGTRLCEELLRLNFDVIGIDKQNNIWNKKVDDITIIGDLQNKEIFDKIDKKIDLVIHLAANARVYNLVINPQLAKENVDILYNTIDFCRENDIKDFIFASSREVYGNNVYQFDEANVKIEDCESSYTASKMAGEAFVQAYRKSYGMNCSICRFSNVYGMYDNSDRVIPLFIRSMIKNKDIFIYGEEKCLDFTYIDDTVAGVIKVVNYLPNSDIFNISSGKKVYLQDVAQYIKQKLKSDSNVIISGNRVGEVLNFEGNIKKAQGLLNFYPKINIVEGINKAIEWYTINEKNRCYQV